MAEKIRPDQRAGVVSVMPTPKLLCYLRNLASYTTTQPDTLLARHVPSADELPGRQRMLQLSPWIMLTKTTKNPFCELEQNPTDVAFIPAG